MFETWFFAVRGLMPSASAISAFSMARAIRRSTSRSRGDSSSIRPGSGSSSTPPRRTRPSTTSAARGESHATPFAAARTASTTAVDRRVLGQEATRAGLDHGGHVGVVGDDGQRDDARRRMAVQDLASGLGPFEVGHPDVHQDDVRLQLIRESHAHPAARRLRNDLDVGLGSQQRCEPGAKQIVIVDHEHADRPMVPRGFVHVIPIDYRPIILRVSTRPRHLQPAQTPCRKLYLANAVHPVERRMGVATYFACGVWMT